jgi:ATP-dependent RNA helicase RhlE
MTFDDLNLNNALWKALDDLGYKYPTTIQGKAFPVMMSGRDVVGIAQTGTGKTFAYLLPTLRQWKFSKEKYPQIMIIVPTRELVVQVVEEVKKLSTYMNLVVTGVYGGVNMKTQMDVIHEGIDVIVATPGRLLDLALNGTLKLKSIKKLVIDEVDEMLNLGFRFQLTSIMDILPPKRQNLMFSATITDEVEAFINDYFNNPAKIEAAPTGTPLENIVQTAYHVPNFYTKVNLLELLLTKHPEMSKVLVFVATKQLADDLFEMLDKKFPGQAGVIHSNKSQNHRFSMVKDFHEGKCRFLIATDIIARGIDISEVTHVVNFDTPEIAEDYMHRIGRTGRADSKGISITFITEQEREYQENIEALMNYKIPVSALPEELLISNVLRDDELPKVKMKTIQLKMPKKEAGSEAFHEKKDKNKKVNKKIRRVEEMRLKYGKPKTRGQKKP